jgi:hypothetical protein
MVFPITSIQKAENPSIQVETSTSLFPLNTFYSLEHRQHCGFTVIAHLKLKTQYIVVYPSLRLGFFDIKAQDVVFGR